MIPRSSSLTRSRSPRKRRKLKREWPSRVRTTMLTRTVTKKLLRRNRPRETKKLSKRKRLERRSKRTQKGRLRPPLKVWEKRTPERRRPRKQICTEQTTTWMELLTKELTVMKYTRKKEREARKIKTGNK